MVCEHHIRGPPLYVGVRGHYNRGLRCAWGSVGIPGEGVGAVLADLHYALGSVGTMPTDLHDTWGSVDTITADVHKARRNV